MASDDSARTGLAIGVDGGGTKTEVWIASLSVDAEPNIVGRGLAASSNPRAVGMETALQNLGAAIDAAWRDAQRPAAEVDIAVLAMSGAGHATAREQIGAWARERGVARVVRFEHDAEPVLAEGTPTGQGIALIVGTGSAAIGADRDGAKRVVGGWGYHYGDEGSAYWIGRRAMEAVARASDGRSEPTALVEAIAAKLGVSDPRGMLGALEQTGNVRGALARLAVEVERLAREGDAAADRIVEEAAQELAEMVATLAKQVGLGSEFPLALAGGVICGSELLRGRLIAALAARSIQPTPVKTVPHPVAGCIRIARRVWQAR